jgi:hypothetical protein
LSFADSVLVASRSAFIVRVPRQAPETCPGHYKQRSAPGASDHAGARGRMEPTIDAASITFSLRDRSPLHV